MALIVCLSRLLLNQFGCRKIKAFLALLVVGASLFGQTIALQPTTEFDPGAVLRWSRSNRVGTAALLPTADGLTYTVIRSVNNTQLSAAIVAADSNGRIRKTTSDLFHTQATPYSASPRPNCRRESLPAQKTKSSITVWTAPTSMYVVLRPESSAPETTVLKVDTQGAVQATYTCTLTGRIANSGWSESKTTPSTSRTTLEEAVAFPSSAFSNRRMILKRAIVSNTE